MAIDYISSFNAGELSEYMDSRIDMEKYRSGCTVLENMYVLPQGGVERRTGTKYIAEAISENSRLISFNFSDNDSYIIEFGEGYIRVYNDDGFTDVELTHTYSVDDIADLKFKRVFDIIYLITPTMPVYTLSRTDTDPLTFSLDELVFEYPPLLEENTDTDILVNAEPLEWVTDTDYSVGIQAQTDDVFYTCNTEHTSSVFDDESSYWDTTYQEAVLVDEGDEIILNCTDDIFTESMEGSYFRMRHNRSETSDSTAGTLEEDDATSSSISVSGTDYKVSITNDRDRSYRSYLESTSLLEGNTGSGWSTIKTWSDDGSYSYSDTGETNQRIRVRKTNDETYTTYSIKSGSNRRVSGSTSTSSYTTESIDVSFSEWEIRTGGTWNGTVELEKSTDNGDTWTTTSVVSDTTNTTAANTIATSTANESGTTLIRLQYTKESGSTSTFKYNINVQSVYSEGLAILGSYISATRMEATITNAFGSASETRRWTEGAFSDRRGYPNAIEIFENRMVYSGTDYDPSTLWLSIVDDYENFQLGTADDEAIKIIPATPERTQWLLAKSSLNQGTAGSILNNYSIDSDSAITPTSIKTSEDSSYGCEDVQALFANDITVYIQRLGRKMRELVYNWETEKYSSNDLTILSNHITEGTIKELTIQKTPDQIVWIVCEDGTIAGLTYERNESVAGWHRHDFGGDVKSIAVRPADGEDELWIIVERDGGYYIEKTETRTFSDDLLDSWYVDSGVKTVNTSGSFTSIDVDDDDTSLIINAVGHGLVDDDKVLFTDVDGLDDITYSTYTVGYLTDDTFTISYENDSTSLIPSNIFETVDTITVSGSGSSSTYPDTISKQIDGDYTIVESDSLVCPNELYNDRPYWSRYISEEDDDDIADNDAATFIIRYDGTQWTITSTVAGSGRTNTSYTNASTALYPPRDGWEVGDYGDEDAPTLDYDEVWTDNDVTGTYEGAAITWDGLDHLEGEIVQVQGDGGYEGLHTVVDGSITTDDYYNQTIIGKPFVSIVQPMLIEPASTYPSVGTKKNISHVNIKFLRTVEAIVGTRNYNDEYSPKIDSDIFKLDIDDEDKEDLDQYQSEEVTFRRTSDAIGTPLTPYTGSKKVYLNDTWEELKSVYIVQNIPMPMTVLSIALDVKDGDGR